jgi:hypothetical protein
MLHWWSASTAGFAAPGVFGFGPLGSRRSYEPTCLPVVGRMCSRTFWRAMSIPFRDAEVMRLPLAVRLGRIGHNAQAVAHVGDPDHAAGHRE